MKTHDEGNLSGDTSRKLPSNYLATPEGWNTMDTAPKDGTEITLRLRHKNYAYCKTDGARAQWQQDVTAKWIDFNGGGWTWHGMCGDWIGWKPLPKPEVERRAFAAAHGLRVADCPDCHGYGVTTSLNHEHSGQTCPWCDGTGIAK